MYLLAPSRPKGSSFLLRAQGVVFGRRDGVGVDSVSRM